MSIKTDLTFFSEEDNHSYVFKTELNYRLQCGDFINANFLVDCCDLNPLAGAAFDLESLKDIFLNEVGIDDLVVTRVCVSQDGTIGVWLDFPTSEDFL